MSFFQNDLRIGETSSPTNEVGNPPPIYTISSVVDETSGQTNEAYDSNEQPPKYEPKLTPPSYDEVTTTGKSIIH